MSGGIIIQRARALLVCATDDSIYPEFSSSAKSKVDEIDAKDPASRTETDVDTLCDVLQEIKSC